MAEVKMFSYANVRHAGSDQLFERAVSLFKQGKVVDFVQVRNGLDATVLGTSPYSVSVSLKDVTMAYCDCYMGQNNEMCKHVIALALASLYQRGLIDESGNPVGDSVIKAENARQQISAALRKITSYSGPSSTWFAYQGRLDLAAGMIADSLEVMEINLANAKYLWQLIVRLARKLSDGGVDDSNGTIGGTITSIVRKLVIMADQNDQIRSWLKANALDDTGFDFEKDLQEQI